jgi:hypothetical protein
MTDWQRLAAFSHYQTATAVRDALQSGQTDEAVRGLEELIDALFRADRRALQSHLIRLMAHIIKWNVQPGWRSRSWTDTIADARETITEIQEDTPSLTDKVIQDMWERALRKAHREARRETGLDIPYTPLTWEDVFDTDYTVE